MGAVASQRRGWGGDGEKETTYFRFETFVCCFSD